MREADRQEDVLLAVQSRIRQLSELHLPMHAGLLDKAERILPLETHYPVLKTGSSFQVP